MIVGFPIFDIILSKSLKLCKHNLYDFYDRLHFLLTASILVVFGLLTGSKQLFGNPIDCYIDKQIDDIKSWRNYIHNFCLFHGTFRYQINETGVHYPGYGTHHDVMFYQWVPLFFVFQFICFNIPHWSWSWMQKIFYLDMSTIVKSTKELLFEKKSSEHKEHLDRLVTFTYNYFDHFQSHKTHGYSSLWMNRSLSCILYIFTKLLYIGNAILQLKLMTNFLGLDNWFWAFEEIKRWTSTRPPTSFSKQGRINSAFETMNAFHNFPILVGCQYEATQSIQNHVDTTIQCVIPLNVIYEKLFVGLWIWIVVLIGLSIIGTMKWVIRLLSRQHSQSLIFQLLRTSEQRISNRTLPYSSSSQQDHRFDFVHNFLGSDGILLVFFMIEKCGVLKTQEVINGLFDKYLKANDKDRDGDKDVAVKNAVLNPKFDAPKIYRNGKDNEYQKRI